jgi:hypothetical protein
VEKKMEIVYLKNGIEIIYSDNEKLFVAYQAIVKISDVYIDIDNSNIDFFSVYYSGDNVGKYAAFRIYLSNKQTITVVLNDGFKYFRRYDKNEMLKLPWLKRIFLCDLNKQGLDKKAENWLLNKPLDMYEIVGKTKIVREDLVKYFNEWNKE